MSLITTLETLKNYFPPLNTYQPYDSGDGQGEVDSFRRFQQDLEDANYFLKYEVMGVTIYDAMNEERIALAKRCEAYKAAIKFIPTLDLSYSDSGFVVTNNQNQVPASKERVIRLIEIYQAKFDHSLNQLLEDLEDDSASYEAWKSSKYLTLYKDLPTWTCRILTQYYPEWSGYSLDFRALRGKMKKAGYNSMIPRVGMVFYKEINADPTNDKYADIIDMWRTAFVSFVMDDEEAAVYMNHVVTYLVKNIDNFESFKTYWGENTRFENTEDNSIYNGV